MKDNPFSNLPPELKRALAGAFMGKLSDLAGMPRPDMNDPAQRQQLRDDMRKSRHEAQLEINRQRPYIRAKAPKLDIENTTYRISNAAISDFMTICEQFGTGRGTSVMLAHLDHSASYSLFPPGGISVEDLSKNPDKYKNHELIVVETVIRNKEDEHVCNTFEDFVLTMRDLLTPMTATTPYETAPAPTPAPVQEEQDEPDASFAEPVSAQE